MTLEQKRLHQNNLVKMWKRRNPEKIKEYREKDREKRRIYSKAYNIANRERIRDAAKKKLQESPHLRIKSSLATRIRSALKRQDQEKVDSTMELAGCDLSSLIRHIEDQFTFGMSWRNYGTGWHIDHIRPCRLFDLRDEDQRRECFHFSNLQPMWARDNLKKGGKIL